MLINIFGFSFIAAGVISIVNGIYFGLFDALYVKYLELILGALWVTVGIGLLRRKPTALTHIRGIFIASLVTIVIVPFYALVSSNFAALGILALLFGGQAGLANFINSLPKLIAVLALTVLVMFTLLFWFYRYFRRPEVAEQFSSGESDKNNKKKTNNSNWANNKVYLLAVAYGLLVAFSGKEIGISQSVLPAFMQSKEHKERAKQRAIEQALKEAKKKQRAQQN